MGRMLKRTRACPSGKAGYRTRGDARRAAFRVLVDNAQAVAPTGTTRLYPYQCREPGCGLWHLTRQPQ